MKKREVFVLGFVLALAPLAKVHAYGEVPPGEKDELYYQCVDYHIKNKTAGADEDGYMAKRALCRTKEQREHKEDIAKCVKTIGVDKNDGWTIYGFCAQNLGFGPALGDVAACNNAERVDNAKNLKDPFVPSELLYNCAIKEFREHRQEIHACALNGMKLWATPPRQSKLIPICLDSEQKAALPQIAACSKQLADSVQMDWKSDYYKFHDAVSYVEECSKKVVRDSVVSVISCRSEQKKIISSEFKRMGVYKQLVSQKEEDEVIYLERFTVDNGIAYALDQCLKPKFLADHKNITQCAIEIVTAMDRRPFISMRDIDGESRAYETVEAEEKCMTETDRTFQHQVVACMQQVASKLNKSDLQRVQTKSGNPKEAIYLWCEMTVALMGPGLNAPVAPQPSCSGVK